MPKLPHIFSAQVRGLAAHLKPQHLDALWWQKPGGELVHKLQVAGFDMPKSSHRSTGELLRWSILNWQAITWHDKTLYIQATCKKDFCRPCNEASTQYHFPGLDHHRQSTCRSHLRLPSLGHWVVDIQNLNLNLKYMPSTAHTLLTSNYLNLNLKYMPSAAYTLLTSNCHCHRSHLEAALHSGYWWQALSPSCCPLVSACHHAWTFSEQSVWSNQMYDSWRSLQISWTLTSCLIWSEKLVWQHPCCPNVQVKQKLVDSSILWPRSAWSLKVKFDLWIFAWPQKETTCSNATT